MSACRKCSIVGGRYAILRKELFFSKKFTNGGARPGKGRVSKTTPLLGDIPRLMSGQADQKLAPFAAGVNPVRNSSPAIAGLETERGIKPRPPGWNPLRGGTRNYCKIYPSAEQRGIISNGVKNKDLPPSLYFSFSYRD